MEEIANGQNKNEMDQDEENENEHLDDNDNANVKAMDIDHGVNGNVNVVDPVKIKSKAMPNPMLGDKNEESQNEEDMANKLVADYKPIQHTLPNDDDMKIEQHILDDLDDLNDDESYLDIDLSKEQNALINLKGLLNSMQFNANTQDDQQSFLSLFKRQ